MANSQRDSGYPRPLSVREKEWLDWILPQYRIGYKPYYDLVQGMSVIGEGRRGKGEIILGIPPSKPDFDDPLTPVFAYGTIETDKGKISITLREVTENQISVEIVSHASEVVPEEFMEIRRWTYSTWNPGEACPQCSHEVRAVPMHTVAQHEHFVLAICFHGKRLWVHDSTTRVNRLIPVTNFYNELMLHKNIRDPKVAIDANLLFNRNSEYSDADLVYAFLTYNKIKTKVRIEGTIQPDKPEKRSFAQRIRKVIVRK